MDYAQLTLRCTVEERKMIKIAAIREGMGISEFIMRAVMHDIDLEQDEQENFQKSDK